MRCGSKKYHRRKLLSVFYQQRTHNGVFSRSTATTNKIKELRVEFSDGFVFAFYLAAAKWITAVLSAVWQALRDSQAGTIEVKVWERCYEHDLKFCRWSSPTGLLPPPPLLSLSITPSALPLSLVFPLPLLCTFPLCPSASHSHPQFFFTPLSTSSPPPPALHLSLFRCSRIWFL